MKRKILLLMLTLGFLGYINAQTPRIVDDGSLLLPYNINQRADAINEGEATYTITLNLVFDTQQFRAPSFAYLIDATNQNLMWATNNGQGGLQAQVQQGTYDIVAYFRDKSDYSQHFIIFEQCVVNEDLTLTLNPEDCTNHISTRNYGPAGELLKLGIGHVDWENYQIVTDEEGDVESMGVTNILYLKGTGSLISYSVTFGGTVLDEESRICPLDMYVNDISNRFVFIQERIGFTSDLSKSYCSWLSTDNVKTGLIENNPSDYVQQSYTFKFTPSTREQRGFGIENALWRIDEHGVYQTGEARRKSDNKLEDYLTHEVWSTIPNIDPNAPDLNIVLQTNYLENDNDACTLGPGFRVYNSQKEFINLGHHGYNNGIITNDLYAANENNYQLIHESTVLSYPVEHAVGLINDCCPINALQIRTFEDNSELFLGLANYYVGRYGEVRWCKEGIDMIAKFNGTEIDLSSFIPDEKGVYELTVTNTNVEVDGKPGHNTTTVYFDQNQEDMTPPSIEMLQFKNVEGGVTDRFSTAADGTMEFYASDFHYNYYPEIWTGLFECKPVDVLVDYAPYGTEAWEELTVEEVPEQYLEPGWGNFYCSSLSNVTCQAENGWYDLRFRLTDDAGNWQEQVLSPAFRIDDLAYTSVATITPASKSGDNAIYNLAGQRMRGDLNSLPHGIYIANGKKVVK